MVPAELSLHPAQRRWRAENLVRLRRSDEQRRYAAPQRAARVDANPHQIDAVVFALGRLREGGCILADEVGLGKTIEAGLVIAQLLAEGARRILLITPKPLLGQWRQELYQLFDLDTVEGQARPGGFEGEGVFLIGREAAGSSRGRDALLLTADFDLVVIDEAHEIFSGIHKRFDKLGVYRDDAQEARTAGRVREFLVARQPAVLLLTATPIQNSLFELWSLVQYVDPLGTLLGDLATFRTVFCGADERQLAAGQEWELRSRLKSVLQRTLRRDAQVFLEKPFVGRQARLVEYRMSPAEKALYDDVTGYLLEPGILAFEGRHRQLLLLSFHRLLASSTAALASGLEKVARRLEQKLADQPAHDELELLADLEATDEAADAASEEQDGPPRLDPALLRAELARVRDYAARARAPGAEDGKFRALLKTVEHVRKRPDGAGKLVIFTESVVTQKDLCERLVASRLVGEAEVTLFAGDNSGPRARAALARWRAEVPAPPGQKMNPDIATRLALVHEFRTHSRVLISTEAGAKGLNLQFCDTLVNYDLPWNPQRIEQRIGRCHRYGQQHEVTVINFLAQDNLAQQLTFEILSQKLELFGTVLDASDQVLHRPPGDARGEVLVSVLGGEFEAELRRIYERARSIDEVTAELTALRERMGAERRRFEEAHTKTAGLIRSRLDDQLQRVFRSYQESVPGALAELDREVLGVVQAYLVAAGIPHERAREGETELLRVAPSERLPEPLRAGLVAALGASRSHAPLSLAHPLVRAAVAEAQTAPAHMVAVVTGLVGLAPWRARTLRLRLLKLGFDGFERVELIHAVLVDDAGETLPSDLAEAILQAPLRPSARVGASTDAALDDATDQAVFELQARIDADEQQRYERACQQAERFLADRLLVLRRERAAQEEALQLARQRRDGALGSEARSRAERALLELETGREELVGAIQKLEGRDDETYRRYQQHIHHRRYSPPRIERLFDLELIVE